jgi:putative flippase GtrA
MSDPSAPGARSNNGEHHEAKASATQFIRYLAVGAWNTAFGYACFALLNYWLAKVMPAYSYLAAYLLASVVNISVAFLGYKWFVFRTRGNYLREWLRTVTVYSGGMLVSALALAPLVGLIRHATRYQAQAPYIGAAVVTIFTVMSSFWGHRQFSFRRGKDHA